MCRDHVLRQAVGQPRAQSFGVGGLGVLADDVGHQSFVAWRVFAGDDDGLGEVRARVERGLDFAEFDAEAADLDLGIDAAEELEIAIGQPAGEVAGAIEAGRA